MEKIYLNNSIIDKMKPVSRGGYSFIYSVDDMIVKLFDANYIRTLKNTTCDLERKILSARPLREAPEIVVPTGALYYNGKFVGYSMPKVLGRGLDVVDETLSMCKRADLYYYADVYSKLEKPVRKATSVVMPDFLTISNIIVDDNGLIKFIDYDGMQIGRISSVNMSSALGDKSQYLNSSKYRWNDLFTKNLDKKSLTTLYFLMAFNVNLNAIGRVVPGTSETITFDSFMDMIGLDDLDVLHNVYNIFNDKVNNEYLGNLVYKIADKYSMNIWHNPVTGIPVKRLEKK